MHPILIALAKAARRAGLNLNYLFDPKTALARNEPLFLGR